jgi:ElaB/YqjD/DUF883 family membrane-anchored ribosome-binding protein
MDNESEVIRHQMEETRTSLQEKLETLEQQVKETVLTAKETVQTATEAVTETVSSVKEAVQDTVGTVKESVQETVETVKETFDLRQQVERHPWVAVGGAVAVGFVGGRLLDRTLGLSAAPPVYPSPPTFEPPMNAYSRFAASEEEAPPPRREEPPSYRRPSQRSWWETLAEQYSDELNKVKDLAISTLGSLVGEMIVESVPPPLKQEVKEVVNSVTSKLGGHPLQGSLFNTAENSETHSGGNGTQNEAHDRPYGTAYQEREEGAGRFDR